MLPANTVRLPPNILMKTNGNLRSEPLFIIFGPSHHYSSAHQKAGLILIQFPSGTWGTLDRAIGEWGGGGR